MTKLQKKSPNPKETLMKKQWAKYVSKGIALSLMHYNETSTLYKAYKNSTYCAESLTTDEVGKVTSTYCKNRWCGVCNRIKTARLINVYMPQLQEMFQPVFVTVTLPTVDAKNLHSQIIGMEKTWRLIYKKTKQAKYKRSNTMFKGIRKAECTIRPGGHYHYHFHFILDNWIQAEWFVAQWLRYNPSANPKAQDIRFANEFAFRELFKYAFKAEVKADSRTNAKRYDVVFQALRGKRTIQTFGGIKAVEEDFDENDLTNSIVLEGMPSDVFKWCQTDWYSQRTGLGIVNKDIPDKVKLLTAYPDNTSET